MSRKYSHEKQIELGEKTFDKVDKSTIYFARTLLDDVVAAFYRDLKEPFSADEKIDVMADAWVPVGACLIDDDAAQGYLQMKAAFNVMMQNLSDYPGYLQEFILSMKKRYSSPNIAFHFRIGDTDNIGTIVGGSLESMAATAKAFSSMEGVMQIGGKDGIEIVY